MIYHLPPADTQQVIEGCHWDSVKGSWLYLDGSLCRGTGEDPTVDSQGLPACADGRIAVLKSERVMCVVLSPAELPAEKEVDN